METDNHYIKRWILPKPINKEEKEDCKINYTLQKVLSRRGINIEGDLNEFLTPLELPRAEDHFSELNIATQRIIAACHRNEKIAICGDYDADGITSTVLLVELINKLGGIGIPYIPSRKEDGYGLNIKMVEDISSKEINLIITVDNGISAFEAIKRSNELNIDIIITDHHKIPDIKIDIFALIHPERSPENSPYKYLAGVGIAYMLAKNICNKLSFNIDNTSAKVLFCIGTVADMAPVVGANRKWLKDCLPYINKSQNIGIRSIIKKLKIEDSEISTDDIGYKIAPLINAVGRIGDPSLIIDLLTNSSENSINDLTSQCFALNIERKKITSSIERDALALAQNEFANKKKFLVLTKGEWHPGVIGIVAARIVEKFNLPTALIAEAKDGIFRGSIRSNNQLKVNKALDECKHILVAHGGHSGAAGFTVKKENILKLTEMLNDIAIREFNNSDLSKSINPESHINFKDIDYEFYRQLLLIGPFGIMNKAPIFWTRKCRIVDIYNLKGNHLKLRLNDGTSIIDAIQWNSSSKLKLNDLVDIAFYIEINKWNKVNKLQLNILDIKKFSNIVNLQLHNRIYKCKFTKDMKIEVTNSKGECIYSDISFRYAKGDSKDNLFFNKIIGFAEIALGKTA